MDAYLTKPLHLADLQSLLLACAVSIRDKVPLDQADLEAVFY